MNVEQLIKENFDLKNKINELQNKFETIFEETSDGLFIANEQGNYLEVNKEGSRILGYSKEELVGKNLTDLLTKKELEKTSRQYEQLNSANLLLSERQLLHKSGKIIYAEINIKKLENGNLIQIIKDITEKKNLIEKAKESEDKFIKLLEATPDMIIITRMSNGVIVEVNDNFTDITRFTKEEVIGKTTLEINLWNNSLDRAEYLNNLENYGFVKNCEYYFRTKDGEIRKALVSANVTTIKGEKYFIGNIKDITEYDALSKKLKASEEKFSKIFKLTPNALSIISLEDRKILEVNDEALNISGYSKEELLSTPNLQENLWVEPLEKDRILLKLFTEGYLRNEEVLVKSKYNKIYNCLFSSEFIELDNKKHVLNVLHNVTELKQFQEKLENERKNLKTLIETLPDLVWVKDLEGKFLSCNNKFELLLGVKETDIIGKTDYDFVEKELANFFREDDKKVIENNKPTSNLEWLTFKNDGHKELVQTIKTPLYDHLNKLVGILCISRDITDLYKTQEEIKRLNLDLEEKVKERTKLLEQANKDLEAFAYSVSHDLRAPIRHIDGFTNLLKLKLPIHNDESDKYIEKITHASKQMSLMIDELLNFSKLGRKKLEKTVVSLNSLINQIIEQCKPDYANRKITFEVETLPDVLGDFILLQSVFENIISNAIKFTSKKEEAFIKIGLIKEDTKQIIYIKDNGAGFDMAYSNKLFGVFQRLHIQNEFSGTGVGLANVKQIITKHGWTIHAEAEVDKGATFFITLNT